MTRPTIDLARLFAEYGAGYERLARAVALIDGFALQPFTAPNRDVAQGLAHWIERDLGVVRWLPVTDDWSVLNALLAGAGEFVATVVYAEALGSNSGSLLRLLNQKRDVLPAVHPRPLLWGTPPALQTALWRLTPDLWSIAGTPVRLEPAATGINRSDRRRALYELLLACFSSGELLRFVSVNFRDVVPALPSERSSAAEFTWRLIEVLESRGLLDHDFFGQLMHERPRFRSEIAALAAAWEDPRATATGSEATTVDGLKAVLGPLTRTARTGRDQLPVLLEFVHVQDPTRLQGLHRELRSGDGQAWYLLEIPVRGEFHSLAAVKEDWDANLADALARTKHLPASVQAALARREPSRGEPSRGPPALEGVKLPLVVVFEDHEAESLVSPLAFLGSALPEFVGFLAQSLVEPLVAHGQLPQVALLFPEEHATGRDLSLMKMLFGAARRFVVHIERVLL